MAKTRVGINGFGRIGRNFFRAALERDGDFEIVAFNDLGDVRDDGAPAQARFGARHLPRRRRGRGRRRCTSNGKELKALAERDPGELPWRDLGVDVVLESTGFFTKPRRRAEAPRRRREEGRHLGARDRPRHHARARRERRPVRPPSSTRSSRTRRARRTASRRWRRCCTTRSGSSSGFMTTIHAYTNDQQILDLPHKDLRRARAAAINLIPTSTGAAPAIGLVLPRAEGQGRRHLGPRTGPDRARSPTSSSSSRARRPSTTVNAAFKAAADDGPLAPYLEYSTSRSSRPTSSIRLRPAPSTAS